MILSLKISLILINIFDKWYRFRISTISNCTKNIHCAMFNSLPSPFILCELKYSSLNEPYKRWYIPEGDLKIFYFFYFFFLLEREYNIIDFFIYY